MVYVSMENQFAFLYDVLRRAMAADPDYKVGPQFSLVVGVYDLDQNLA